MLCEYVWLCHTQKRSPNVDHRSIALHAGNQGASDPRSQHAHVRAHTHRHAHTQKHIHTHTCMSVPSRERKSLEASLPEAWKACLCISGRRCVRAWGGQDERKGEHCVVHAFAQVPVLARGAWSDRPGKHRGRSYLITQRTGAHPWLGARLPGFVEELEGDGQVFLV